jgi:uncharacterized damage-inducible protein DinB
MYTIEIFHQYFKYHYALNDRIWESVKGLTDTQYHQEYDYSRGSVHTQMFHITATDRAWLRGIKGIPRKPKLDLSDFPERDQVRGLYEDVKSDVTEYLSYLTEDELVRVPEKFYGPVWQVLTHVVNHGTDHRAQILRMLHDHGIPTTDQDFILWLWRP